MWVRYPEFTFRSQRVGKLPMNLPLFGGRSDSDMVPVSTGPPINGPISRCQHMDFGIWWRAWCGFMIFFFLSRYLYLFTFLWVTDECIVSSSYREAT